MDRKFNQVRHLHFRTGRQISIHTNFHLSGPRVLSPDEHLRFPVIGQNLASNEVAVADKHGELYAVSLYELGDLAPQAFPPTIVH
jgi:hypothetical protein